MIPTSNVYLSTTFEVNQQPNKTYRMDLDNQRVCGHIDKKEAIRQAIFKILNTERYQYLIYSWNYGIELLDLFGMPVTYVCPELERRIKEALTWDERIKSVSDFSFSVNGNQVWVTFTAHTIEGDIQAEKEVTI